MECLDVCVPLVESRISLSDMLELLLAKPELEVLNEARESLQVEIAAR